MVILLFTMKQEVFFSVLKDWIDINVVKVCKMKGFLFELSP